MARNEIRIRRKPLSAGKLARYRNYENLIARHERDIRIKRLSKLIIYVLIIVILVCTFLGVYIIRQKQKAESGKLKASVQVFECPSVQVPGPEILGGSSGVDNDNA